MPLLTRSTPLSPNSADVNQRIAGLAVLQNAVFASTLAAVDVGMTTRDLADIVRAEAGKRQLALSMRGAGGFPDDAAIGVRAFANGVPSDAIPLKQGDLLKLAIGSHEGESAFCMQNWTVAVGGASSADERFRQAVLSCLNACMPMCRPGTPFSAIAAQLVAVSKRENFCLSRHFAGAPIGAQRFLAPLIVQPRGLLARDAVLSAGVMLHFYVLGHADEPDVTMRDDGSVQDGKYGAAASFSHMVLVTDAGPQVLTSDHG